MFYSKSTNGFYEPEVNKNIPSDAVAVTVENHTAILLGQSAGKVIIADINGFPMLADPPLPSHVDLVAMALTETREQRQPIISILDGMQSSANTNGDTTTAKAIEAVKQSLKDITKTDLSACVTYEDMRQAMKAAYAAIVMAAPASVITAFASVVK